MDKQGLDRKPNARAVFPWKMLHSLIGSGPRGRWFESTRPDQKIPKTLGNSFGDGRRWPAMIGRVRVEMVTLSRDCVLYRPSGWAIPFRSAFDDGSFRLESPIESDWTRDPALGTGPNRQVRTYASCPGQLGFRSCSHTLKSASSASSLK